jgi:hypothetical protein
MMVLNRNIHLRPTGPEATYCRADYLRGVVISLLLAGVFLGLVLLGSLVERPREVADVLLIFGSVLSLMSLASALILGVQGVLCSVTPIGFAVAPNFVPPKYRDSLRDLILGVWDPEHLGPLGDPTKSYDRYLPLFYELGRAGHGQEYVVEALEGIENRDGLAPGSDPARRLEVAARLRALFQK